MASFLRTAATAAVVLSLSAVAWGDLTTATSKQVTNTTGGKNQNPVIGGSGKKIVFKSNVDQSGGLITDPNQTFDFNGAGNDFAIGSPPHPICVDCNGVTGTTGNLFIWRLKRRGLTVPANSV